MGDVYYFGRGSPHNIYLGNAVISLFELTNNKLYAVSVNLISYLIFDGEIDDKEFYRCN